MRRIIALVLIVLLLWGCAPQEALPSYITVSLSLPTGCYVDENRQQILSGDDVFFELTLAPGYRVSGLDYDGTYSIEYGDNRVYVLLENVLYPTMATVKVTSQFCTINYEPNGAVDTAYHVSYDREQHLRPNTEIGNRFEREGYTQLGWNTEADGSGTAVGLGSRVSVPENTLTLYAQWIKWSDASLFDYEVSEEGVRITGYHGTEETIVIPAAIGGMDVITVGSGTFWNNTANHVILPNSLVTLEAGAFEGCQLQELTMFDNLENFSDDSFRNCVDLTTIHINAAEPPYGYDYRRESCLADKVDILIEAQGNRKIVFYGGCSMWYNLNGELAQNMIGEELQVINLGLNGVINSTAQMQILSHFMEEGDVFFHTPEISSEAQLLIRTAMINHDRKLWSGMEYNYDLVSLIDLRTVEDFFDIYYYWLSTKKSATSYTQRYVDYLGNDYVDQYGCASFYRDYNDDVLEDKVSLNPSYMDPDALARMESHYQVLQDRGVTIYVSYACVNVDALPEGEIENAELMDQLFRESFSNIEGVTVLGTLQDHLFHNTDFYDTNYHLLTSTSLLTTYNWMEDLVPQLVADGIISEK